MSTQITDHVAQAVARMASRDADKPKLIAFLSILVEQIQGLEDGVFPLLVERSIDNAIGQQLDDLGEIVDQPRNGQSDTDYRVFLRARISANNSDGRVSDLIAVARATINDPSLTIKLDQFFPKGVVVRIQSGALDETVASILVDFLQDAKEGEVKLQVHFMPSAPSVTFTFGSIATTTGALLVGATTIPVDSTKGFDDAGDVVVDKDTAFEDTASYTSKTATAFLGVTGIASGHSSGVRVGTPDNDDIGFGSTVASGGGVLSSVIQ